jgi:hypothetical protein
MALEARRLLSFRLVPGFPSLLGKDCVHLESTRPFVSESLTIPRTLALAVTGWTAEPASDRRKVPPPLIYIFLGICSG